MKLANFGSILEFITFVLLNYPFVTYKVFWPRIIYTVYRMHCKIRFFINFHLILFIENIVLNNDRIKDSCGAFLKPKTPWMFKNERFLYLVMKKNVRNLTCHRCVIFPVVYNLIRVYRPCAWWRSRTNINFNGGNSYLSIYLDWAFILR